MSKKVYIVQMPMGVARVIASTATMLPDGRLKFTAGLTGFREVAGFASGAWLTFAEKGALIMPAGEIGLITEDVKLGDGYIVYPKNKEAELFRNGVWCCSRTIRCKWRGALLEAGGLAWGIIPPASDSWTKEHAGVCGGRLVQLIGPSTETSDTGNGGKGGSSYALGKVHGQVKQEKLEAVHFMRNDDSSQGLNMEQGS